MPDMDDLNDPARVPDWLKKNKRYRALLETHGNAGRAAAELGIELYQAGQVPRAAETLQAAVEIAPQRAPYWGNYGVVLNHLGQREKAVAMLNKSLALDSGQFQVWLNLANTLVPLGHADAAAEAFEQAARDPGTAAEALAGLGLLHMAAQRHADAAVGFRKALDLGEGNAVLHANLGSALFQTGNAAAAADAYAAAAEMAPEESGYAENATFLAMLAGVIGGKAEEAVTAYAKPLEDDAVLISAFRRSLLFLNAYGPPAAVRSLIKEWLDYYPEDAEARYAHAINQGRKTSQAPHAYIVQHFDELASRYDDAFLESLQYRVPAQIRTLLARTLDKDWKGDILDAGCGRGVMAPLIEPFASSLTGVDLSPRMIEFAGQRVLYDELIVGDFVAHLEAHPKSLDLIVAADTLIYIGNLEHAFKAVAQALRPGGWFAFNTESANCVAYELQANGRFAHANGYIQNIARQHFEIAEATDMILRQEAGKPIRGTTALLHKI